MSIFLAWIFSSLSTPAFSMPAKSWAISVCRRNLADASQVGFRRVLAVSPALFLGNPVKNAEKAISLGLSPEASKSRVVVFPELSLTGYTVGDLFFNAHLLSQVRSALNLIREATSAAMHLTGPALNSIPAIVVGAPYQVPDGRVFNVAFVIQNGRIVGAVPKTFLPNYGEFYEKRHFDTLDEDAVLNIDDPLLGTFVLGSRQIFHSGDLAFAIEICEDGWATEAPATQHALAGANVILNLSSSNDLVGKAEYRRDLFRINSSRYLAGYVYVSSGSLESSQDMVFGGHIMGFEAGTRLADVLPFDFEDHVQPVDFDVERLAFERRRDRTFGSQTRRTEYKHHFLRVRETTLDWTRIPSATPFVPTNDSELQRRFEEILNIQATGLARQLESSKSKSLVLGLSGGLDSTWALLVCLEAAKKLGWSPEQIKAYSLPGPGTSKKTRALARDLAAAAEFSFEEVSITPIFEAMMKALNHPLDVHDLTFENAQARARTDFLFNKGFVVGTGDLSELWLGWCTYNADHMSSYNVNVSLPKTLIRHLTRSYAQVIENEDSRLAEILFTIAGNTISPELIPGENQDDIGQSTEAILGSYDLHDFFLFYHLRYGFGPEKIFALATQAFARPYTVLGRHGPEVKPSIDPEEIKRVLLIFYARGFKNQFKRTAIPSGPKVGTVSVSSRGDLRAPNEAEVEPFLERVGRIQIDKLDGWIID